MKNKIESYLSERYTDLLSSMFKGVDFVGRFEIESDTDKWNEESEDIWKIKKGKQKNHYHILFDGEHIFSMDMTEDIRVLDKNFLIGFMDAYENQRIYLTEGLKEEKLKEEKAAKMIEEARKEKELEKDLAPLSTDEKAIARKVLDETTD